MIILVRLQCTTGVKKFDTDLNYMQLNKNKWYTFLKGETNEHSATTPESANNRPTSATLRMFSSLSSGENPRFLFNPVLMLSPSNPYDGMPEI